MDLLVFFFADLTAPAAISLAAGVTAAGFVPALLLADAHRADFPRLWQASVDARHDVDRALAAVLLWIADAATYARLTLREAALTAAALLALLVPTTETTS
ncbi:MAG TPA: hypothetical protein VLD67_16880 [Vicinamibacterales bacterium]|nr:hypothetical protein [Vicinamibacterales bacterium]